MRNALAEVFTTPKNVRTMPNTFSQIYIQVVFAVQGRQSLITSKRKEELQKYITGIITRQGQKLIAILHARSQSRADRAATQHGALGSRGRP
jgi:hypothetical protein